MILKGTLMNMNICDKETDDTEVGEYSIGCVLFTRIDGRKGA